MNSNRQVPNYGRQPSSSGFQKASTSGTGNSGKPAQSGNAAKPHKKNQKRSKIPEDALDDVSFRFINSLPDEEIDEPIRFCFQLEQAHWYYVDFYCDGDSELSLRDFSKQICSRSGDRRLNDYGKNIDSIINQFHQYKQYVPVNGVALLDKTMTYVLLVQGMRATQDSWGFPKGKVNQDEEPVDCAAREVLEEVGYDCSGQINPKKCSQKFIKKTCTRVYFVKDVPLEYEFKPRVRNEIKKIQWFKVCELPNSYFAFVRIRNGPTPRNFFTIWPFVDDLQAYVKNELKLRTGSMVSPKSHLRSHESNRSAFEPVAPGRRQSQNCAIEAALVPQNVAKEAPKPQSAQTFVELLAAVNKKKANQFIPVKETSPQREVTTVDEDALLEPGPSTQRITSIKPDSFLQMFVQSSSGTIPEAEAVSCSALESTAAKDELPGKRSLDVSEKKILAAIGSEAADRRKQRERQSEIRQPKARQHPVNQPVYEAEPEPEPLPGSQDASHSVTPEPEDNNEFYYTPVSERRPTPGPNASITEEGTPTPKRKNKKQKKRKNQQAAPKAVELPCDQKSEEPPSGSQDQGPIYDQGIAIDLQSLLQPSSNIGNSCSVSALTEQMVSDDVNRDRSGSGSISNLSAIKIVPCESWKRPFRINIADLFAKTS
uniref:mRNA-decapping enzyme 2 n=1 Tax=Steinernema glaseri TaxID=37863 RepID=A0A1I7XZJ4_9BILA